jgi:hypothetical protein
MLDISSFMMQDINMRTTFSIDPDLAPKLKALVRRKKDPMRKVINDLIRLALGIESRSAPREFEVKSQKLTLKTGYDPGALNALYDELETESAVSRIKK